MANIHHYSIQADPFTELAKLIIKHHQDDLPNLAEIDVIVPSRQNGAQFRRALSEQIQNNNAILGPNLFTLDDWLATYYPSPASIITYEQSLLLVVDALRQSKSLTGKGSPWQLASELLNLFREFTLNNTRINQFRDAFIDEMQNLYGIKANSFEALTQEAGIVHTLWHAWLKQLAEMNCMDKSMARIWQLNQAIEQPIHTHATYCITGYLLNRQETELLSRLCDQSNVHCLFPAITSRDLFYGENDIANTTGKVTAFQEFLETATARDKPFINRAESFRKQQAQSPASEHISVYRAGDNEQEVIAAEIQIRLWLQQGADDISVICEDRRFARRLRARLERSGILLQDLSGWALSTTRAAATLERWLECIEQDFACQPMLDLLKSAFFRKQRSEEYIAAVHHFEQDIILHENIPRGLERYRKHIEYRHNRLDHPSKVYTQGLLELIGELQSAASSLTGYLHGQHTAEEFITSLLTSLRQLGLDIALRDDTAGLELIELIEKLIVISRKQPINMNWLEFRTWIGRAMEDQTFRPFTNASPVRLMNLKQSEGETFSHCLITNFDHQHYPGNDQQSMFFNQGVRSALSLPVMEDTLNRQFYLFKRLLIHNNQILITYTGNDDEATDPISPWIQLINAFHHAVYGQTLDNLLLPALVTDAEASRPLNEIKRDYPETAERTSAAGYSSLLPEEISVSAHQSLIDCPYQFFATQCLKLQPPDEISEALKKSDYGERIHLCLQAFHTPVKNLPKPFDKPVIEQNRSEAIEHLARISQRVFEKDLEDNFEHKGWLEQWLHTIPDYIDWQIRQTEQWAVHKTEQKLETQVTEHIKLKGRLDRIDKSPDGENYIVRDYKTGASSSNKDMLAGESVQLISYAILFDQATNCEYVSIDSKGVKSKGAFKPDAFTETKEEVSKRLHSLFEALKTGTPLPAWGDKKSCHYCVIKGLCRQQIIEN